MKISPRAQAELKVAKFGVAKDDAIVFVVIKVAGAAKGRVFEEKERAQGR
jgi:hypothetical protein